MWPWNVGPALATTELSECAATSLPPLLGVGGTPSRKQLYRMLSQPGMPEYWLGSCSLKPTPFSRAEPPPQAHPLTPCQGCCRACDLNSCPRSWSRQDSTRGSCLVAAILEFPLLLEQEALNFHFVPGPANEVTSSAPAFLDSATSVETPPVFVF